MTDRPSSAERRLAAVWFADVPGFTRLSAENEPEALRVLEILQALANDIVPDHDGTVVKFMGDGVLAEFASTDAAAEAALRLQMKVAEQTGALSSGPHLLRVGLHLGEVTIGPDGDVFGDGVNRASRLEGLAEPGQLLVSEDVFRQLRRRPDFQFEDGGEHQVRNVPETMRVHVVSPGDELASALAGRISKPRSKRRGGKSNHVSRQRAVAIGTTVAVVAFVGLISFSAFSGGVRDLGHDGELHVAVLPFQVDGPDAQDQQYFANGLASDLITELNDLTRLRVKGRRSSFQFREAALTVQEISLKLGVQLIVTGTVETDGSGRMRITADVEDVEHDGVVVDASWEGSAEDAAEGQLAVSDELIEKLIETFGLSEDEFSLDAISNEAHAALVAGREALEEERFDEAVAHLERAVMLAPESARIKIVLADAWIALGDRELVRFPEAAERASMLLTEATEQSSDPEAHTALAELLARVHWDAQAAEAAHRRALAENPTAESLHSYAHFLTTQGRHDEAGQQVYASIQDQPGSTPAMTAQGILYYRQGKFAMARVLLESHVGLHPDDEEARIYLALAMHHLGDSAAALEVLPADGPVVELLLRAYIGEESGLGDDSDTERALEAAEGRGGDAPYWEAAVHMARGDASAMFEALDRTVLARSPALLHVHTDPVWEPARGNERFDAVVRSVSGR